jgi:hypothetical protein
MRVAQGWYQFNPKLSVRRRQGDEEHWTPIYRALNLPLINEFARDDGWESVRDRIAEYLAMAGLPAPTVPLAAERAVARQEALAREQEKRTQEEQAATRQPWYEEEPKWGTREAKRMEIERLRRAIEARKKR